MSTIQCLATTILKKDIIKTNHLTTNLRATVTGSFFFVQTFLILYITLC